MSKFLSLAVAMMLAVGFVGCSEETEQKTEAAAASAGDDIKNAGEKAAEGAKNMAADAEKGVENAAQDAAGAVEGAADDLKNEADEEAAEPVDE